MVVVVLGALCAVAAVAAVVLALAVFVAFIDEDRRAPGPRRDGRLMLRIGAVTFIGGLAAAYVLARLDGRWAIAGVPALVSGIVLLARGERARHRSAPR